MAAIRLFLVLFCVSLSSVAYAQHQNAPDKPADYLSKEFHRQRREQLKQLLPARSVAVFFASPIRNRANDVDYHYHPDPDLYYLTGYKEPNAVLLLFSEKQAINGKEASEVLFLQPKNPKDELWNGPRMGVDKAMQELGVEVVLPNTDFARYSLMPERFQKLLIKPLPHDVRDNEAEEADLYNLLEQFKQKIYYGETAEAIVLNLDTELLDYHMNLMREVKTPEELKLLRRAVDISVIGQVELMKALHPGMSEAEVMGVHEFVYRKYGANHEGYPSIVGAGHNGCVLHYITNNKPQVGTDLVLMDLGAEYGGYTADITRTVPATGKFTPEQKQVYELVLKAQEAGIKECKVGNNFFAPGQAAQEVIADGLVKLGILKNKEDVRRYFPHGTSHYLGLDVHDRGTYNAFKPNTVITVEPGIYIPEGSPCDKKWWGIAVRIEDDILITEKGPENLSAKAPRTVAAIEALMAQPSPLDKFVLPALK